MTKVYFVRHAQPDFNNHDDFGRELTEMGMFERKRVTEFLADKHVEAVISSPYRRAVDTVSHFAQEYGMEVEIDDGFRERNIGRWVDDFAGFSKSQWSDFDYKLPGGESLKETQERNIAALGKALERYPGKVIAIGSHGTALSTIINYFDSSFGYMDFEKILNIMPWIVEFDFDDNAQCVKVTQYDEKNRIDTVRYKDIRIQRATPDDIDLLIETRIRVLRAANGLSDDVDMENIERESLLYYFKAIIQGDHAAFLAYDGQRVVGTGGVSFFNVMPTYHNPSGRKAYIMNMYTDPDYRRRGIATRTLDALVQECRKEEIHAISLEATEMGRPLYEKYGFVKMNSEMELPE